MSTAVVRWSRMGPVSSPSSAQNTVKPASWSPSIRVLGGRRGGRRGGEGRGGGEGREGREEGGEGGEEGGGEGGGGTLNNNNNCTIITNNYRLR